MTGQEFAKAVAWGWRNGGLVMRVLGIPEVRNLLDALKELGDANPGESGSLHETLTKVGIDTKQLAEAIHPPGSEGSGNPDAMNAGSNNASI